MRIKKRLSDSYARKNLFLLYTTLGVDPWLLANNAACVYGDEQTERQNRQQHTIRSTIDLTRQVVVRLSEDASSSQQKNLLGHFTRRSNDQPNEKKCLRILSIALHLIK